jgi:hypothetical protein
MKQLVLIIFLISAGVEMYGQVSKTQVTIYPYCIADVGYSSVVMFQKSITCNFFINAGIKYHHFVKEVPKMNNERLHHRFFANKLSQHFGFCAGIRYNVKWKNDFVQPFLYYDLTYFNMDARSIVLIDADTISEPGNEKKYAIPVKYYGLQSFENNLGLGLACKITGNLYLNTRAGIGANLIFNLPKTEYTNGRHINSSYQYAIGLEYAFKSKKNKQQKNKAQ